MQGIEDNLDGQRQEWESWAAWEDPEELPLPAPWQEKLTWLQRLLVIRVLRPDRLCATVFRHLASLPGLQCSPASGPDLEEGLKEASSCTPLLLVQAPGVDCEESMRLLAARHSMADRYHCVPLGPGKVRRCSGNGNQLSSCNEVDIVSSCKPVVALQEETALARVQEAMVKGQWVLLADCHLAPAVLASLEAMVLQLEGAEPHSDFRLLISCKPMPGFSIPILERSIKVAFEPPTVREHCHSST